MGNAPVTSDPTDDHGFDTSILRGILQTLEATKGALTDRSSTVTLGGAFQNLFAASTTAIHRSVQNPVAATETLSVKIGSTVYELAPGGYIERNASDFMPTDAWTIKAATTAHAFIAGEA